MTRTEGLSLPIPIYDHRSESDDIQKRLTNMQQQVSTLHDFHARGLSPLTVLFIGPSSTGKTETISRLVGTHKSEDSTESTAAKLLLPSDYIHVIPEGGRIYWSDPEMRAYKPSNPLFHRVRIASIYVDQIMDAIEKYRNARLWLSDNSPFNSLMIALSSNPTSAERASIFAIIDMLKPIADMYTLILLFNSSNTILVRDQVRREQDDEERKKIYQTIKETLKYIGIDENKTIEIKDAIEKRPLIAKTIIDAFPPVKLTSDDTQAQRFCES